MSATVYGKVYNNITKAVIPTAIVSAPPYTVSNSGGSYTFSTPGMARVDITASATGYTSQTVTIVLSASQVKRLDFYLNPV